MKKKYKLIKEYPGSPKKGSIATVDESNDFVQSYTVGDFTYEFSTNLKAYPEFWEEVEEKKYEILSVLGIEKVRKVKDFDIETGGYLETHPNSNEFYPEKDSSKHILSNFTIYSIKRLSDGEVFSIGDKIKAEPFVRDRKYTVIDEIYYNEHDQLSYETYKGEAPRTFVFDNNVKHYKEPLFVTKDGVGIYGDEEFYFIRKNPKENTIVCTTKGEYGHDFDSFVYFSSREKAIEWKKKNIQQPLFITEDGKEIYDKFEVFYKVIIPSMMYGITQCSEEGDRVREQSDCKYFSTKEAAENFIYNNKLIYSRKNIIDAINKSLVVPKKGSYVIKELLKRLNIER